MSYPSSFVSVFARNCQVRRITADVAREFLVQHHRFAWSRCKYCYGLFIAKKGGGALDQSGNEAYPIGSMVAVSCFSNARRWNKDGRDILSYEWVRFASLQGVRVQGGMSKMLQHFIDEVHPDDIMSYAPVVKGDEGSAYELLGFKEEGIKEFQGGKSLKYRLKLTEY